MEIKLQNILFPDKEKYKNNDKLFFKSVQTVYDDEKKCLATAKYNVCEFVTYLNALSIKKWKKYCNVEDVFLRLDIEGAFELKVTGYHLEADGRDKGKIYYRKRYNETDRRTIEIPIPEMKETIAGFEINTLTNCFLYGGAYYTNVDEENLNKVNLSIATTTFKKEDFIKRNIKLYKEELLSEENIGEHIFVHVVDNGRTLKREEIEGEHVFYHPNKNVGGSGGFSRGMMESMYQNPKATNVLLMDDDVEILPESIRRTYILLLLQKERYKDYFISGAMLRYEHMTEFSEDVGYLTPEGYQVTLKGSKLIEKKSDLLANEEFYTEKIENKYAGWWYCCIPMCIIEKSGFSLPLFVRGDDTEYSLRNHAKFITMNGICVWHLGFATKFNYFMEYYQVFRNLLIICACNHKKDMQARILDNFVGLFWNEITRFNYQAAEFFIDAIRDYMKGPEFIEEEKCQERLQAFSRRNAELKDINEFPELSVDVNSVYQFETQSLIGKFIYRITWNGQRFIPKRYLRKGPAVVASDLFHNPQRQYLQESVIAVNPYSKTGEIRKQDRKRCKKVVKEFESLLNEYKKKNNIVIEAYYAKRKYLVSEEFWKNYLEIEKYQ